MQWVEFITKLKYAADIEDVISPYVQLKRNGRNRTGLCPFHLEKTPSFVVYGDTQSFYCFGCGAGGDIITFIMKEENLDYIEAVKFLAQRYNIPVPEWDGDDRSAKLKQRVLQANVEAARYFHDTLKKAEGKVGLDYLISRGITKKTIISFGLGFAPDSWDGLKNHLISKQFTMEEMSAADLVVRSQKGGYYDRFRGRVIFPIIDLRGNVIAFGGRILEGTGAKYLNSADTPAFKKSRNLFALNFAKNVNTRTFILAEGYMDVISVHQAGFTNAVATLGTALTNEQARLISRYADNVIIAYDSDEAGQKATSKASSLLDQAGLDAKVLVMDGAKDPDEYIKKFGAEQFSNLLDNSKDVFSHKLAKLKQIYDISGPEGKTKFIRECINMISECRDPVEREIYAGIISKDTETSKEVILKSVSRKIAAAAKAKNKKEIRDVISGKELYSDKLAPEKSDNLKQVLAEENLIWYLFNHPDSLEYITERIQISDIVTDWGKKVFSLLKENLKNGPEVELTNLSGMLTSDEMGKLSGILAKKSGLPGGKIQLDDYIDVLLMNKNKKDESTLNEMTPEEIQAYIFQRRNGKKP